MKVLEICFWGLLFCMWVFIFSLVLKPNEVVRVVEVVKYEKVVEEVVKEVVIVKKQATITELNNWDIDTMNVIKVLDFEEGFRTIPYLCSEGYITVGLGTKLHNSKGMNPKDFPISVSRKQAEEWLHTDVANISLALSSSSRGEIFKSLDHDKRAILISMTYQMGISGVLKFRNMWQALGVRDYTEAANEALDSRWARQTPERAGRHARVLFGESLDEVYTYISGK